MDVAALTVERLVDDTKKDEETTTTAADAAALSSLEEAQVNLSGSTYAVAC